MSFSLLGGGEGRWIKPKVNAFVDGETCNQTVLMVNVCA
jgi:hypothetical protein